MVANNDSILSQAAFKNWRLNTTQDKNSESELNNLLTTMTRTQEDQLDLRCSGGEGPCQPDDSFCNCTLTAIAAENTFQVFLVLQSKKAFGTEWCPHSTIRSDFFFCDEEKTEKISAKYRCDATVHCAVNGYDESRFVCSPGQIKLLAIVVNLLIYSLALVSAVYLVFFRDSGSKIERITAATFTDQQRAQITNALKLIKAYIENPGLENEENMTSSIRKLPKKTQMALLKIAHNIEAKRQDTSEKFFALALQKIFSKKSERKALLMLVKESSSTSTKLKIDVLEGLESQGWLKRIRAAIEKKCSQSVRINLGMLCRMCGTLFGLLLVPLQDIKDLVTIVSIKIFFQEVLQERIELIDNVPLHDFITILIVIYAFVLVLKLLNAFAISPGFVCDRTHSCNLKILGCWFNPHLMPFVTEAVIGMRTIQTTLKIYNLKLTMKEAMDQLKAKEERDDQAKAWDTVLTAAEQIEEEDRKMEALTERKRHIKMISCTGF